MNIWITLVGSKLVLIDHGDKRNLKAFSNALLDKKYVHFNLGYREEIK